LVQPAARQRVSGEEVIMTHIATTTAPVEHGLGLARRVDDPNDRR